jgi:nitrogen regulatory protein PII
MKIITAMLQPFMLSKVVSTLEAIDGFPGMTLTDVRGFGRRRSAREEHRMQVDDFHEKSRIEIVAPDDLTERIVRAIIDTAHTGNNGDGKIFVGSVEHAVRIQTGETDDAAI